MTFSRAGWVLALLLLGGVLLAADHELGALAVGVVLFVAWQWAERRATRRHQAALEAYHAAFQYYVGTTEAVLQQENERAMSNYLYRTLPDFYARYMAPILSVRSLPFQPIPSREPRPPVGRSEHAFRACLEQHFGEHHIIAGTRVSVPGVEVKWYYPDFVYCDSSGLCIDIEIDEPYVWTTREATHYRGKDDRRNALFLHHNWAVVRFTEEQVVRYPHLCCQELAALIFYLTGRSYAARLYQDHLPRMPHWDWVEARFLAERRAREEYNVPNDGG